MKGVSPKTGLSTAIGAGGGAGGKAADGAVGTGNGEVNGAGIEVEKKNDLMAKMITFCRGCAHGFHADHAREWFAKHKVCPVVDCECCCMALG